MNFCNFYSNLTNQLINHMVLYRFSENDENQALLKCFVISIDNIIGYDRGIIIPINNCPIDNQ